MRLGIKCSVFLFKPLRVQPTILTLRTPSCRLLSILLVLQELLSGEELLFNTTLSGSQASFSSPPLTRRALEVSWLVLTGSAWPAVVLGVSVAWMEVIVLLLKAARPEVLWHPTARDCGSGHPTVFKLNQKKLSFVSVLCCVHVFTWV